MPGEPTLEQLLAAVRAAPGLDRMDHVPAVAAFGEEAVVAVTSWLDEPECQSFAVRTMVAAAASGDDARTAAIAVLREHLPEVVDRAHAQRVRAALASLQRVGPEVSPKVEPPRRAVIVGSDPFASTYKPPLSIGESNLLRRLLADLPGGWRVYPRPHLDGDRPAVALLHRERGAMLWHVRPGGLGDVVGEPRGYRTRDATTVQDPVAYINALRQRLYADYLPAWAEAIDNEAWRFGIVRAGVLLPDATEDDIFRLGMAGRYEVVVAATQLQRYTIDQLVPNAFRETDMEEGWFETLDTRFSDYHPPTFSALRLTDKQRERVLDPLEPGWRGIEGVAGAGKSTTLAWRAASLARQGKRVLLVTYNQTLANYCRALSEAAPDRYLRANLVVQHFHGLCHVVHRFAAVPVPLHPGAERDGREAGGPSSLQPMDEAEREHYEQAWPSSTLAALEQVADAAEFQFDSILVDEAQDFSPEFFNVLRAMGKPEGEVVLAFDRAQRLYARTDGVRANLDMRRIKGLDGTRRLRQRHADIASTLGLQRKLPTARITLDDDVQVLISDEDAQWVHVRDMEAGVAAVVDIVLSWSSRAGYRPDGTVILAPSSRLGRAVVETLAAFEIDANHIFPEPGEPGERRKKQRRRKVSFVPDDQRIKVATIHSYKGWEADDVILLDPPSGQEASPAILYVALTRPKSRLVVVASRDDYGLRSMFDERLVVPDDAVIAAAAATLARQEHAIRHPGITGALDDGQGEPPPPEEWGFQ